MGRGRDAEVHRIRRLPRFLHALTAVHAVGAGACFVMAVGSAVATTFRASRAVSGGSAIMASSFREGTCAFLSFVGVVLAHARVLVLASPSVVLGR